MYQFKLLFFRRLDYHRYKNHLRSTFPQVNHSNILIRPYDVIHKSNINHLFILDTLQSGASPSNQLYLMPLRKLVIRFFVAPKVNKFVGKYFSHIRLETKWVVFSIFIQRCKNINIAQLLLSSNSHSLVCYR